MFYIDRLNKVQNKFIKISTYRYGVNVFRFISLNKKRIEFDVTFVYRVFNGFIDIPDLLSKTSLAVFIIT